MAVGDLAAAAGIAVVPSTKDLKLGYEDINRLADALAVREKALSDRATALEATTQYVPGTPVFAAGWSDAGTKVGRVGRVVVVVVRAVKNDTILSGETMFTVPAGFRPALAEVGSVGYLSGNSFITTPVPLQSDGKVRVYYKENPGNDRTVTSTITFLLE